MNRPPSRNKAFTLIELLVVIVIIAILAAILLPVITSVQKKANSTKCLSNLKQIAAAMVLYSTEHDDVLPGPLKTEQFPVTNDGTEGALITFIDPYLTKILKSSNPESSKEITSTEKNNIFLCPEYAKLYRANEKPVYLINTTKMSNLDQSAFGDADAKLPPAKRAALTAWTEILPNAGGTGGERPVPLPRLWALIEADSKVLQMPTPLSTDGTKIVVSSPLSPVIFHEDHRNAIFFDMHVEKMPLEGIPQ